MAYTAQDLFDQIRSDLDDEVEPYLWKDTDLLRYLNRTREEFSRRRPIIDNTTDEDAASLPVTEITLVADTRDYAYSPFIQMIDKVVLDSTGYELEKWSADSLDRWNRKWRSQEGTPEIYVEGLHGPHYISFLPIPESADTVYMTVQRTVLAPITFDTLTTAITEPHEMWQEALLAGMKKFAYLKQDSEVRNPELSAMYGAMFDAAVGPPISAEEVENRRLGNNSQIHYQPTPGFRRNLPIRGYNRYFRPDDWW